MFKRIISLVLVLCIVVTMFPATAFAAQGRPKTVAMLRLYNPNTGEHFYTGSEEERDNLVSVGWNYEGIAWYAPVDEGENIHRLFNPNNGDHHYSGSQEEVDTLVELGWQYEGVAWNTGGKTPQYRLFNPNADVGMHHYTGSEEERDYLVSLGWHYEGISWYGYNGLHTDEGSYTVSFYDGGRCIDSFQVESGEVLGKLPTVEKASKDNAILVGYYKDKGFTQLFYADEPVTEDMDVYAKYEELGAIEELSFTSFAQMDQSPDLIFEITRISGDVEATEAAKLRVMDGSDPVPLSITESDGSYIVKAVNGFNEGCSYQLDLADGWIFEGKPETIRIASFSIEKEEVKNLKMSDEITYIQDTNDIDYTIGSNSFDVLTSELIGEDGGSFSWFDAANLEEGDLICVYAGKHPEYRESNSDLLDPAVYVKVKAVEGNQIQFEQLDSDDQQKLYEVPDNFPINVEALPTGNGGTVNLSDLDVEMYKTMMGEEEGTMEAAKSGISEGDFVTLYISTDSIESEESLYYGKITKYDAQSGEITYEKTSRQAILDSMDLYAGVDLEGSDFISDEEVEELEASLLAQVEQSGFAEDAAYMLADLITATDGFRNNMTVQDFLLTDKEGNPLSEEQIELLNIGGSFELTDDIKLTVELIKEGDQLHFDGGVQLAIGVEAGFEVELESDDKIAIDLSATFVQEVTIDPTAKGEIVYKEILFIPIPIGVKVGASIDIKSFTALSFAAEIYTVGPEDKTVWAKIKNIAKEPADALGLDKLPEELVAGLDCVGDIMDKIEELNATAKKAKETNEKYQGYLDDAEALWGVIEENGLTTREDWEKMSEELGKTSITSDLLDMMNLTTETGLSTEYYESMQDLMERFSEMVEKETDWITLVEQKIFAAEISYFGLVIGVEANFVVRADLSIAIGSNLQYQIGKRYEFWFKIGLFKPTAGNTSMDLIDEQFAFQFYVMGRLGVKAGVRAKLYVALGSGDFASVGIATELGPYIKLYGFFVYEYTKYRPANTSNWISDERMAGALFMEFGLYFILGFEANALGDLFEYSYDFLDKEIPLLTAGDKRYHYMFNYAPEEGEMIVVRDVDNNSTNGITMELPQELLNLAYVDLNTGAMGYEILTPSEYIFTLSNPNFSYDPYSGIISVNIPENTRYMECDLVATYRHSKMAFSQYDMTVTIPLVWTNLATAELNEYYSASVRMGNNKDGFETVWTKRILKNKQFDLPSDEQLKDIIKWSNYKHTAGSGYGSQATSGLTIIDNKAYDYDMGLKTYALKVSGIQYADGTTGSKTFYAKYGESFDFSSLADTGANADGNYTKFAQLTNNMDFDLTRTVNGAFVDAINSGLSVEANYVDNSATATFVFTGLDHEDISQKICRGTEPSLAEVEQIAADAGFAVKDIFPAFGSIDSSTTFQVIIGEIEGPEATITFEENGGAEVSDITKAIGSLIGNLPTPEYPGHAFEGWYLDNETFTQPYTPDKMPEGGLTVYAKWNANAYTLTFHVNGGDALEEGKQTKQVFKGVAYGELPVPERTGYGFQGWFTAETEGEQVTAETIYDLEGDQTLYAQWKELVEIPRNIFDFGETEEFTYKKGVECKPEYTFTPEEGALYKEEQFTFKYKRQGSDDYTSGIPINAGTYDVTIVRLADSNYAKFEQTYVGVINTKKAVRPDTIAQIEQLDEGLTWIEIALVNNETVVDGSIYDLNEDAELVFNMVCEDGSIYQSEVYDYVPGATTQLVIWDVPMRHGKKYDITVSAYDPNYEDWTSTNPETLQFKLRSIPTTSWDSKGQYDITWYNSDNPYLYIDTASEFAGLAYLVNSGTDTFRGKKVTLEADIELYANEWVPIGFDGKYFEGIFDGGNHLITGVYANHSSDSNVGLFGDLRSIVFEDENAYDGFDIKNVQVNNIVLDDSYIGGKTNVGGIAGNLTMISEVADFNEKTYYTIQVFIANCTNYAQVYASSKNAGGIAGTLQKQNVLVYDCVNYGKITGTQAGGIAGCVSDGMVIHNANYGTVFGETSIGGIVGYSVKNAANSRVQNNYNCGQINGSGSTAGAIVGNNSKAAVKWNYYLADDEMTLTAVGSETDMNVSCSSFEGADSRMSGNAKEYKDLTLLEAINKYIDDNRVQETVIRPKHWVADSETGYPFPSAFTPSSLR